MRANRLTVFRGKSGQYYWRLRAPNGRIVCDGSEGYTRNQDARRAMLRVAKLFRSGIVRVGSD